MKDGCILEHRADILNVGTRERLKQSRAMTAAFAPLPFVYEDQLANDLEWALREGSLHFEQKSAVQATLRGIAERLNSLNIDYAVADSRALFQHGLMRGT